MVTYNGYHTFILTYQIFKICLCSDVKNLTRAWIVNVDRNITFLAVKYKNSEPHVLEA